MKAGAAKRDITPADPVILISGEYSTGIHDPLYARALVLEDGDTKGAVVALDLPLTSKELIDDTKAAIQENLGIDCTLLNFTHTHSGMVEDEESLKKSIVEAVREASDKLTQVTITAGRESVQVGYNRRITNDEGQVSMGENREGAVVPWVNVLTARDGEGNLVAVLIEHAAHPVIVHDSSSLFSRDYPGEAVAYLEKELGEDAMPIFVQGCGGNINGYPIASGFDKAREAGVKSGEAVMTAMKNGMELQSERLEIRTGEVSLPSQPLPPVEVIDEAIALLETDFANGTESGKPVTWVTEEAYKDNLAKLMERKEMVARGDQSRPRNFLTAALMIGTEWCLVAMDGEMFCEYELWVDKAAPFEYTMTLAYTNGISGYIGTDAAIALGGKGGYEAGTFPCWWSHGPTSDYGNTPAVGTEELIHSCIASLWGGE